MPTYSWVVFWNIARAQGADMAKSDAANQKILDKAVANCSIMGYGDDEKLVHQAAQLTTLGETTSVDIWRLCRVAVFLVVELVAGMVGVSMGDGLLGGGAEDCGLLGGCESGGCGVDRFIE
jgi:hypothetical protein